jgi:hypothetical protein
MTEIRANNDMIDLLRNLSGADPQWAKVTILTLIDDRRIPRQIE